MLFGVCKACAMEFAVPFALAGKQVKCPTCKQSVRIEELFDSGSAGHSGSGAPAPAEPLPRIDVFARHPSAGRQSDSRSSTMPLAMGKLAILLVFIVAVVGIWQLYAGDRNQPDGGEVNERPRAVAEQRSEDGATTGPAPSVAEVPVAAPPRPVVVTRSLPPMPPSQGIDLLTPRMLTALETNYLAWSGSGLFASMVGVHGVAEWLICPERPAPMVFDGDIVVAGDAEEPVPTRLYLQLPITRTAMLACDVSWPLDSRPHRLRCWTQADGSAVVAIDAELKDAADTRISRHERKAGIKVWPKDGRLKIESARIYSGEPWLTRPDMHGMYCGAETSKEAPPNVVIAPAELPVPGPPGTPVFRPFRLRDGIDVLKTYGRWEGAREEARRKADMFADCVSVLLRPSTQAEMDLAARLLWLGEQVNPGNARIAAVAKALEGPAVLDGLRRLGMAAEGFDQRISSVLEDSRWDDLSLVRRQLCAWMHPDLYDMDHGRDPRTDGFDWHFLMQSARQGSWFANHESELRILRCSPAGWGYLPYDKLWKTLASTGGNQTYVAGLDGKQTAVGWGGLHRTTFARGVEWKEGDAIADPSRIMYAEDAMTMTLSGHGCVQLVPLGSPERILAEFPIDLPDRYTPPGQQEALYEPSLVYVNVDRAVRVAWRPWLRQPKTKMDAVHPAIDMQRTLPPITVHVRCHDGVVAWRISTRTGDTEGRAEADRPVQVLLKPGADGGLSILRSEMRRAPPVPAATPLDSLRSHSVVPLIPIRRSGPEPAARPAYGIVGVSRHVFTSGQRVACTVYLQDAPPANETLWALGDPSEKMSRQLRWLQIYPKLAGAPTEKPGTVKELPEDRIRDAHGILIPGFQIKLIPPVAPPEDAVTGSIPVSGTIQAWTAEFTVGQQGSFKMVLGSTIASYADRGYEHYPGVPVVVVPAKPGWDPVVWCGGLVDRTRDGRVDGSDYGLGEVLLGMAGELQYEDPFVPAAQRQPSRRPVVVPTVGPPVTGEQRAP